MATSVTVKVFKASHRFAYRGEILIFNAFGKTTYNIVTEDCPFSKDYKDIDELGNEELVNSVTLKLKRLSDKKIVRWLQIKYYRTKFFIQSKIKN